MQATVYRAKWWVGDELVVFLWRSLNRKEYRQVMSIPGPDFLRYAEVYRVSLLAGLGMEQVPAGIVSWIGEHELRSNPFSGEYGAIKHQRDAASNWALDYLNAGSALISCLFGYKFEEIEGWDATTFFRRLAQAEFVRGKELELVDPKAPPPPPDPKRPGRLQRMKR